MAIALSLDLNIVQQDDFRVWTSKDGSKKIEAKLKAFDQPSGRVTLIRQNGQPFTTSFKNLSIADRDYLLAQNQPPSGTRKVNKFSDEQIAFLKEYGLQYSSSKLRLEETKKLSNILSAAKRERQKLLRLGKAFSRGEQQILDAKQKIRELTIQDGQLSQQLPNATTVKENNNIVGMIEAIRAKTKLITDDIHSMEAERDRARNHLTQRKGDYIQSIVEARRTANELKNKYIELGKDQKLLKFVSDASAQLGKELHVRADSSFQRMLKQLDDLEEGVVSEKVPLRSVADTWMIPVTINGTNTIEMVLDTGASSICLPHRDAVRFGITPTTSDPLIRMQIADGSIISGRQVNIPTVRVGKFTVKNVECVVLGPSATSAPRLLGNSFLKNFNLDLQAGDQVLRMQEIK